VDDPFNAIRTRFRERCNGDLALVRRALVEPGEAATPAFRTQVHRLSGLAGSLGYHRLSALAAELDDRLTDGASLDQDQLEQLEAALADAAAAGPPRE
jgi:HPt (histidine-containing phosphotransfer) domain-containing protein